MQKKARRILAGLLILVGALGTLGQLFLTRGYGMAPAASISAACFSVVLVISTPPSMRANSWTRSSPLSLRTPVRVLLPSLTLLI